jgi:ATPase family protein associated with various cellular activities (AAA)
VSSRQTEDRTYQDSLTKQREALRKLGDIMVRDGRIKRGPDLMLREAQSHKDAITEIKADYDDLQQTAMWRRRFNYRPLDGMHALHKALKRVFGTVTTPMAMGFFGPQPPRFMDVEVAFGQFEQVPIDSLRLPCLEDVEFHLGGEEDEDKGVLFVITAEGKKIMAEEVQVIFNLVEEELATNSIYRGQAIDDGYHFLDLAGVDPAKVVYSEVTQGELERHILVRLRHPEVLEHYGVQLKGAVLLEGTFGTGKTLAGYLTAQEAVRNGWGFILVRPEHLAGEDAVTVFRQAMQTAALYGRTVVFVEDVDTLTDVDQERQRISTMLDLFDGARSKGIEVLAVLTTNRAEAITPGMVRPGRIDAVITITPPDAQGIERLCKVLVHEELLDPSIPAVGEEFGNGERTYGWAEVAAAMEGFIPAAINEACSRAMRNMIVRTEGQVNGARITGEDLVAAANGLIPQMELLQRAIDGEPEVLKLDSIFRYYIEEESGKAAIKAVEPLKEAFRENIGPVK